jgi:hypothetical protein
MHSHASDARGLSRGLEMLDTALIGRDAECVGLVAFDAQARCVGLLLHGVVAGATGVSRIHTVVGASHGASLSLVQSMLARVHARMVIWEIERGAHGSTCVDALAAVGFLREGAVPDFFADGVPLDIMVWRR